MCDRRRVNFPERKARSRKTSSMPKHSKTAVQARDDAPAPKLFTGTFKQPRSANKVAATGRANSRVDHATWELVEARYQKGDNVNEKTGNIYMRCKPRARIRRMPSPLQSQLTRRIQRRLLPQRQVP